MTDKPVVLITGASQGIGYGLARRFAARGYSVVGCSRNAPTEDVVHDHHLVDVTDEARVRSLLAHVDSTYGRLDVLVNCAGTGPSARIAMTSLDVMSETVSTNLVGTFLMCRESMKLMVRRRFGRIINIATPAVPLQMEGSGAYAASKAAVIQLSKVLARELGRANVTCNVVAPGPTETRMLTPALQERYLARMTIPRATTIEDIFHVVAYFADPQSREITGQVLYLGIVT